MSTIAVESPALSFDVERQRSLIAEVLAKKTFCTLATSSASGYPHVAGVLFKEVDGDLYVHVHGDSVKARNVLANARVAVLIPVRKIPFGPPYVVHFQGTAEVIAHADPRIQALDAAGIVLRGDQTGVSVQITNPVRSVPPAVSRGSGLIGMRERIAATGGTLEAGPRNGRWLVDATIPAEAGT
jgi:nitroimidazol reductase NimA-like FMN-containing flavoprotein (pyridoxamine 5'-phosphate oxidase superfamily)